MYRVLDKGVEALLALGEVRCTRRFSGMNVGRRVRVSVGVSVSRDLLNLEVTTQDVPPEELLELLKSYRAKKKYHRLKTEISSAWRMILWPLWRKCWIRFACPRRSC